jgi:hypothetical protein
LARPIRNTQRGSTPGEDSSLRTQRSQPRRREATGAARRRGVDGGRGGGVGVDDCDKFTGGEPAGGETEAETANTRLVCIGYGKSSLLTRRHAGGAGGAGGTGGAASSRATTHESARLVADRTCRPKIGVEKEGQ